MSIARFFSIFIFFFGSRYFPNSPNRDTQLFSWKLIWRKNELFTFYLLLLDKSIWRKKSYIAQSFNFTKFSTVVFYFCKLIWRKKITKPNDKLFFQFSPFFLKITWNNFFSHFHETFLFESRFLIFFTLCCE